MDKITVITYDEYGNITGSKEVDPNDITIEEIENYYNNDLTE